MQRAGGFYQGSCLTLMFYSPPACLCGSELCTLGPAQSLSQVFAFAARPHQQVASGSAPLVLICWVNSKHPPASALSFSPCPTGLPVSYPEASGCGL